MRRYLKGCRLKEDRQLVPLLVIPPPSKLGTSRGPTAINLAGGDGFNSRIGFRSRLRRTFALPTAAFANRIITVYKTWTIFPWPLPRVTIVDQHIDFRIEPVQISAGVYYRLEGPARWYASEWNIITCLSLQGATKSADGICKYLDFTVPFSKKYSKLW